MLIHHNSDLRKLNSLTKKTLHPIPLIKNLIQKLSGHQHYILIDLKDSYQSLRIHKDDRSKAAIVTSSGQFIPTRLGYGFCNAPSHFSKIIASVLARFQNVFNYLDDIVLYGNDVNKLVDLFDEVLGALEKAGFRISLHKLALFKKKVKLLGVVVSSKGIQCDPVKIETINQFPEPTTKLGVQKFLGSINFHSDFILDYSKICLPLLKYLHKDTPSSFTFDIEAKQAFIKLKKAVTTPIMLNFIDSSRPVFVETDASNTHFGGYAYQVKEIDRSELQSLKEQLQAESEMTENQINARLQKIVEDYTENKEIPPYDFAAKLPMEEAKKTNPFLNVTAKSKVSKDKIFLMQVNFFISKKFTPSQVRGWTSLLKELSAMLITLQSRADILSLAQSVIVCTDCACAVYLYEQSASHSLMSRYLSKLASYPFLVLVKHKKGKHMVTADNISRMWIAKTTKHPDKVSPYQGILVKIPFPIGSIVSTADIITYIETNRDQQIVMSSSDPTITKETQTPKNVESDIIPITQNPQPNINTIGSTQTGTRSGIKNTPKPPKLNDRNIEIFHIKAEITSDINKQLSNDNYTAQQKKHFPTLYTNLLTNETESDKHTLTNNIIMIQKNGNFVRLCPPPLQLTIILKHHMLTHMSPKRMFTVISNSDYWPSMRSDIEDFCAKCLSCLFLRPYKGPPQQLGYPLPSRAGEILQLDTVSGLPNVRQHSFFCTLIDTFSKFCVTFPLRQDRSEEIVTNLWRIFAVIQPPNVLMSDGATNMNKSANMIKMASLFGIKQKVRTPYSSRSLGLCERAHRSILDNIRSLTDTFQITWLDALPIATLAYNSVTHTSTNYTPHELFFGRLPNLWQPTKLPDTAPGNINDFHLENLRQIKLARKNAKQTMQTYRQKMRDKFGGQDKHILAGMFVLSLNKTPTTPNEKYKLRAKWYGPFLIHQSDFTTACIGENILTGRVGFLNKDLLKVIPEKDILRYRSLPKWAKEKMGGGHTYDMWLDMFNNGELAPLFTRSTGDLEYGMEGVYHEVFQDLEDLEEIQQPEPAPQVTSQSSSDDEQPHQPQNEPTPPSQNSTKTTTPTKTVRFEVQPTRKSSRTIKPPTKLDL
jgi:hypothetical protein